MSSRKKKSKETKNGQFVCGKCGDGFPKAHGLAIHIIRTHKKRTWGKSVVKAPRISQARKSVHTFICPKCDRTQFVNSMSYAAHRRYCKGKAPSVDSAPAVLVAPTLEAIGKRLNLLSESDNGHNKIQRLKAVAVEKRRQADEIDKLVASFESSAEKFLTSN